MHCNMLDTIGFVKNIDPEVGAAMEQELFRQRRNTLHMLTGCDFRHNTTIQGMEIRLGRNRIRQDFSAVLHHCNRSFIARRFKSQYLHIVISFCHWSQAICSPGTELGS